MSRLHESAPLLQYPAGASHFQPLQQRNERSAPVSRPPYQALHIQHRNAALNAEQQRRQRERDRESAAVQSVQGYTFAPHEALLLYDEGDSEDGGSEHSGEESLTLQRVEHSTLDGFSGPGSAQSGGSGGRREAARGGAAAGGATGAVVAVSSRMNGGADSNSARQPQSWTPQAANARIARTTGAAATYGSTGESQSQPHSPVTSALQPPSGYQQSAVQQHSPQASPSPGSATSVKTLDSAPSSPASTRLSASSHPVRLVLYLLLSVVIAVANAITWKRTLNRFRATDGSAANLEFFVTEWTILLYVLLAALILAYRWLFTSLITAEQKAYPQRKFALMGLLDAVAGLSSSLGGAFTSGQTQVILNQANIPVTMLLSRSFLHSRYTLTQYVGAALIVAGSIFAAVPSTGADSAGSSSSSTMWYGPLILLLSCLPNSASNCYKEHSFQSQGLDMYYLTTLVSTWQVLLGCLFCPILSLPGLGGLSLSDIPANFAQGWSCFLGQRVTGYECHLSPPPYVVLIVYVVVNFFYNVLLLLITKHGSALMLVIASALSLPFTNLVFTSRLFMGREAEAWSWWTAAGLLVVVLGFLLYSLATDADTGDWLPAQGAGGQMIFIVEEPVELQKSLGRASARLRRHSFDNVADSPLIAAHLQERKRAAKQRFLQQRRSSRAGEGEADETLAGPESDRVFFTPP